MFSKFTRFFWTIGAERRYHPNDDLMLQKAYLLPSFFYIVGLHHWPEERFVDIMKNIVQCSYNFPTGKIHG